MIFIFILEYKQESRSDAQPPRLLEKRMCGGNNSYNIQNSEKYFDKGVEQQMCYQN